MGCAILNSVSIPPQRNVVFERKGGNRNVLEDQRDLNRDVGPANAVVLHDERIHEYPPRDCNHKPVAAFDQRPPGG